MVALDWRGLSRAWGRGVVVSVATILLLAAGLLTIGPSAAPTLGIHRGTAHGRVVLWGRSLDLISQRPILGWGPDTFAVAIPHAADAEFQQVVGRTVLPDRAHNAVLDTAASGGLLTAAAWLTLRCPGHRGRPSCVAHTDGGRVARCVIAYLAQLSVSFSVADLDVVFWLLAGLLVSGSVRAAPSRPGRTTSRSSPALAELCLIVVVWAGREVMATVPCGGAWTRR